jgi:hypothetical protein
LRNEIGTVSANVAEISEDGILRESVPLCIHKRSLPDVRSRNKHWNLFYHFNSAIQGAPVAILYSNSRKNATQEQRKSLKPLENGRKQPMTEFIDKDR